MTAPNLAIAMLRAAVEKGHLVRDGKHYRFGRRRFSGATVVALRATGQRVPVACPEPPEAPSPDRRAKVTFDRAETAAIAALAETEGERFATMVRRLALEALRARGSRETP